MKSVRLLVESAQNINGEFVANAENFINTHFLVEFPRKLFYSKGANFGTVSIVPNQRLFR